MKKSIIAASFLALAPTFAWAAPTVTVRLPERFRVLNDQLFDLRIEATGLRNPNAPLRVTINGRNMQLPEPEVTTDNDNNPADLDKAWVFRNVSLPKAGVQTVVAIVRDRGGETGTATQRIGVQDFAPTGPAGRRKNIVLFIGDAMGTAYRDAGRIVAKSTENHFREGFYDEWQQMDSMPVSGMVMTYALDRIVPDSANTATAWASGNKTTDGSLNTFPDNNDFKYNGGDVQGTKQFALDNPRVETLWEYLKRLHGYRTGIVSTADITDATPAGQGGHTITRSLGYDIARQYVDGVFTAGPAFDVIMGGGLERFTARTAANSGDTRNLVTDLQGLGFTYVADRTELNALPATTEKVIGLFRTSNMNVAYDKLGLVRDPDEPAPSFGGFTDQPFLEEMTAKAIAALSANGGPYILMVEAASIDKQSHPNNSNGVIWDTIELDKSIGVARAVAADDGTRRRPGTLVLVTADHDQSMSIVGLSDAADGSVLTTRANSVYPATKTPFTPAMGPFFPYAVPVRAVAPSSSGNNAEEVIGFPDYDDVNHDGYPENFNQYRISVGFRTGNHTGSSVPITAEGPGALLFTGYFDQTDIFFKMARALSDDTATLDSLLRERTRLQTIDQNY
ncbi:MAG: alkaline phosphatase [Chthoniobacteraceae bacterium]